MKHIKDFLYNWNDIVIIALILVGAAALISWRVDKIMDYPATLVNEVETANEANSSEEATTDEESSDENATDENKDEESTDEAEATDAENKDDENAEATADGENADATSNEGENPEATDNAENAETETEAETTQPTNTYHEPGSGPVDSSVWENGHLKNSLTVTTAPGTAYDAVDSLIAAGLFTSFDDYYAVCMRVGVDSSVIKSATFTFDSGATQEDIVKQVTQ